MNARAKGGVFQDISPLATGAFALHANLTDVNVVVRASLQARSKLSSETHDDTVIVIVVQGDA